MAGPTALLDAMVGVHADGLTRQVFVDDALHRCRACEVLAHAVCHGGGPGRQRCRGFRGGVAGVVVAVAVVLDAAAKLGDPGSVRDAQKDAVLFRFGNEVRHQEGAVCEDAGLGWHGPSPC